MQRWALPESVLRISSLPSLKPEAGLAMMEQQHTGRRVSEALAMVAPDNCMKSWNTDLRVRPRRDRGPVNIWTRILGRQKVGLNGHFLIRRNQLAECVQRGANADLRLLCDSQLRRRRQLNTLLSSSGR